MDRQSERIAVAERIDLRLVTRPADERIVRGHAAVVADAEDLADVRVRILRRGWIVPIAERHIQEAGSVPREARAVAAARWPESLRRSGSAVIRIGDEDVLDVSQRRSAIPLRAKYCGRRVARSFRARFRVGEIDQPVLREARMQRDVEQTAEAGREHLRHRADRRRVEHAVLDLAQSSWTFGDERIYSACPERSRGVGKERDAPRVIETFGDDRDVDARATAGGQIPRPRAKRVNGSRTASSSLCSRRAFASGCGRLASARRRSGLRSWRRLLSDPGVVGRYQNENAQRDAPRREYTRRPP